MEKKLSECKYDDGYLFTIEKYGDHHDVYKHLRSGQWNGFSLISTDQKKLEDILKNDINPKINK